MNNQATGTGQGFTIIGALGPVMTLLCLGIAIACIVLFVSGVRKHARKLPDAGSPWWLRQLSVWVFLAGIASCALRWVVLLAPVYGGGMSKPEFWQDCNCEAWTRLAAGSVVSLFAWSLGMLLGRQKNDKSSNQTSSATSECAPGSDDSAHDG
jgi:membrane protease YdiL (CAAX protease family)